MDKLDKITQKKIHKTSMDIPGWHRLAKEVLYTDGICTAITAQSNNLLQKIIVENGKCKSK